MLKRPPPSFPAAALHGSSRICAERLPIPEILASALELLGARPVQGRGPGRSDGFRRDFDAHELAEALERQAQDWKEDLLR